MVSISQRIDDLPDGRFFELSNFHWVLLLSCGVGWAMDAMDIFVFSYSLEAISTAEASWGFTPSKKSLMVALGFAGMLVGAVISGALADIFGRRPVFCASLVVYGIGTGLTASSWNITSLCVFRFITGLGLGGELPIASTLVQELSPARYRGKAVVLLESFWAVGTIAAALLAYKMVPEIGWRATIGLCTIPVLYGVVLRFFIPESPKWLASVGRMREANENMQKIEAKCGIELTAINSQPYEDTSSLVDEDNVIDRRPFLERAKVLFSSGFLQRTIMLWILWFGMSFSYYGSFTWLPTIIKKKGFSINSSLKYVTIVTVFQIPGYLTAAYLIDVVGRKWSLCLYLLGSAGAAIGLGYVPAEEIPVLVLGSLFAFFSLGAWGCIYAYTPEQYPTGIRATGCSCASAYGRAASIVGPYLVPWMLDEWGLGTDAVLWMFAIVFLVIAADVAILGTETKPSANESTSGKCAPKVIGDQDLEDQAFMFHHHTAAASLHDDDHTMAKKGSSKTAA